jgi:hypothetical protein
MNPLQGHYARLADPLGRVTRIAVRTDADVDDRTLQELERDLDLEELSALSAKS